MFTRILLPLDGTARAEEALPFARELARAGGAQIFLLHVQHLTAHGPAHGPAPDEAEIARRIAVIAKELRADGIATHVLTLHGQTPETIAAVIAIHQIDLVTLAPEARGLLETLWRPSVTAGLLPHLEAPVLIAPKTGASPALTGPGGHVIVPLDGSALAEQALPLARAIAARYHRGMLLLRVIPPLQAVMTGAGTYPIASDLAKLEYREAGDYLRAVCDQIQRVDHLPAQYMVLNGVPADEILAEIETKPCSILVMSTHGRGGLARFLLGSVALTVARKATIPMIITPSLPGDSAREDMQIHTAATTLR